MKEKYSLTLDPIFKKVFGVEENKDILMSLINAIVDKKDQVEEITLLNPYENDVDKKEAKISILDIKAKGKDGTYYNIEVQVANEVFYMQRALYYWSGMYRHQLEKGHKYNKINKVIGIHILDFEAIKNDKDYFHKTRLYFTDKEEEKTPFKNDSLEFLKLYFVELGKFKKDSNQIKDGMDKWIDVLRHSRKYDTNNLPSYLKEEKEIQKALKATDILGLTEKEYELYDGELKYQRDMASREIQMQHMREKSKKLEKEALERGMAKGLERGREEGEKKGLEKGREEGIATGQRQAAIKLAKSLKEDGMSPEKIASLTSLTKDEIEKL